MKFKRQYILTLKIEAPNSKVADEVSNDLLKDFRVSSIEGGGYDTGKYSDLSVKVHSITPKSVNPKRLVM
jgi:hypothetical protein